LGHWGQLLISHTQKSGGRVQLSRIIPDLNTAADADLVILEGMGRGVESNLDAEFSCDAINLAMIKDAAVAGRHGGKVFDVVCRFWQAKRLD
jgi:type II pantothenate kinase